MRKDAEQDVLALFRRRYDCDGGREILALRTGKTIHPLTWHDVFGRAAAVAHRLRQQGVQPGDVVPVLCHFGERQISGFLGAIFAGAIPCVLAPPNVRMSHEVFLARLIGILGSKPLRCCIIDPVLADFFDADVARRMPGLQPLATREGETGDPLPWLSDTRKEDQPLFLQHSSGTTGTPKAVLVTHRQLLAQLRAYGQSIGVCGDDVIASWLPLYHDMGMVASLWGGLIWNVPALHMDNFQWVLDPVVWLRDMSERRATLCWLPNFAFSLMAQNISEAQLAGLDLRSVRMWISCSEPVLEPSLNAFARRFAKQGVSPDRLAACYAMAENVFAVTQTTAGPPRVVQADRQALEVAGVYQKASQASGRSLVSSGAVIKGTELVLDVNGVRLRQEGVSGEILIRGEYALEQYFMQPEATAAAMDAGWYRTGDIGLILDGELFVIGRKKDLIIVGGRNLDPGEIEHVASGIEEIKAGRCCCVGVASDELGTEEVHLIVETDRPEHQYRDIAQRAKATVRAQTEFQLKAVWCFAPRWLVKSSSGKIARRENRDKLLAHMRQIST